MGHFIVRLGTNDLAKDGHRLVRVSVHKKRKAEMIGGDRITRANRQFGAKFRGGRFEIALTEVDEAHEIVRFREPRIEPQGGFQLGDAIGIILLLRVCLSEKKMDGRIAGVLLQQAAKDFRRQAGLMRSNESSSPSEEQAGIIRGLLEKRMKNFRSFAKVLRKKIAE